MTVPFVSRELYNKSYSLRHTSSCSLTNLVGHKFLRDFLYKRTPSMLQFFPLKSPSYALCIMQYFLPWKTYKAIRI